MGTSFTFSVQGFRPPGPTIPVQNWALRQRCRCRSPVRRLIKDRGVSCAQPSQDLNVHTSQLRNRVKARTASSLNSRVNFRLSMTCLQFH